jgi:hypothetical protein
VAHTHKAGTNELHVKDESKFKKGQKIVIGKGTDHEEVVTVVGKGSLILSAPTKYDHAAEEKVVEEDDKYDATAAITMV